MVVALGLGTLVVGELLGGQEDRRGDVGRIEDALGADVNRTLVAEATVADQGLDLVGRAAVAVVPGEGQGLRGLGGGGEDVADDGVEAPAMLVRGAALGADLGGGGELEGAEDGVEDVAAHVAEGAGAEVEPLAPDARVIPVDR